MTLAPTDASGNAAVDVLMLAYGAEEHLGVAVRSVLESDDVDVRLVLVDNGCTTSAVADLPEDPRLRVLTPGRNLGFTGGMNLAARHASSDVLALVNSDAVVHPRALAALARVAKEPQVGIATASVRLADDPSLLNTAGNPVHVLGLSWAGGLGEPATARSTAADVGSASGACMALRREVWEELGGFPEEFFAYMEDCDLSWRCWQRGLRVRYVPEAVAVHHYEFSRNPAKLYLLERNRQLFVLTCWGRRMLALMAPPLLAFELAMLLVAVAQGWGRAKLRTWWWTLRHLRWVLERRGAVQSSRRVADADLAPLLTSRFDPVAVAIPKAAAPAQLLLQAWWAVVRRLL